MAEAAALEASFCREPTHSPTAATTSHQTPVAEAVARAPDKGVEA